MSEIRWELYPLVAVHERSRAWLQLQSHLQLAPTTLDAYGRSLNDFLAFCQRCEFVPETITREQVALYVQDLAHRPNPKGAKMLSIEGGRGLSNSTMQLRITVLRLFCDSLVERQLRQDNPVGRGHYVPGKAFGGVRSRGLLPRYQKLPWLPSDEEWQNMLRNLEGELLRNQVMLLLAYDGALRREELVRLEMSDFDFAYQQIRVQAEHAKNGRERIVGYEKTTSRLLRVLASEESTLDETWSALLVRVTSQCIKPTCTRHLVKSRRETGRACRTPTIYDPYATSSSAHTYGSRSHGIAPDCHLRRTQILSLDDALYSLERS